ncbi:MAG TPA: helix-turn-helix transcriptional regulator [Trebonia sp.]|nr:helix-turn-helix transcriptional regulator [Trebonia sp.]
MKVREFAPWWNQATMGGEVVSAVKTSALAAFATQLKAWRKSRGWSQEDLAAKLAYSDSLVSGIETAAKTPTLEFAKRCDDTFGTPGTFVSLQELVSREAWPSYFAPVIDFENQAVRIHEWDMRVVPGLLQQEDYARSVISAGKPLLSQAELERKVKARIERKRLFERDYPPMYWAVLHEGVLRQVIGSLAIMGGQLDTIIEAAGSPHIVVQVLPFTASDHPGTDGPITVFDFPGAPSAAYTECNGGGMIIESPEAVAELVTTMNMLRAAALPQRESMDLLRQIRSEIG